MGVIIGREKNDSFSETLGQTSSVSNAERLAPGRCELDKTAFCLCMMPRIVPVAFSSWWTFSCMRPIWLFHPRGRGCSMDFVQSKRQWSNLEARTNEYGLGMYPMDFSRRSFLLLVFLDVWTASPVFWIKNLVSVTTELTCAKLVRGSRILDLGTGQVTRIGNKNILISLQQTVHDVVVQELMNVSNKHTKSERIEGRIVKPSSTVVELRNASKNRISLNHCSRWHSMHSALTCSKSFFYGPDQLKIAFRVRLHFSSMIACAPHCVDLKDTTTYLIPSFSAHAKHCSYQPSLLPNSFCVI